jgi:hypothetical protein
LINKKEVAMAEAFTTFFVAPYGNDVNPGTKLKPFRTILRARDAVRQINQKMTSDIVVNIRAGRYELEEPLRFSPRDSARKGFRITYKAYQDEQPVISGGRKIDNWRKTEGGIWQVDTGLASFRQIYINGRKAVRARLPKTDNYFRLKAWDKKERTITINSADLHGVSHLEKAELIVQLVWSIAVLRIKSYKVLDGDLILEFQDAESDIVFPRFHPPCWPNQAYHLENSLDFLTEKNEWYLDPDRGVLNYIPENDNLPKSDTVIPILETLVNIEGTLVQQVSDLGFEGLSFAYTGWTRPNDHGHLPLQAGMFSLSACKENVSFVGRPPAAVLVSNATGIKFERNRFFNLGATALDLHFGVQKCTISGNLFKDIAGNAILIGIFSKEDQEVHLPYIPEVESEICKDNTIHNNYISAVAQEDHGCVGIGYGYTEATTIQHNEICFLPWTGIHCGWGWTTKHSAAKDNIIRSNHVHHIMQLLIDGAAIYTLSCQPGTLIEKNYLHAIHKSEIANWRPENDSTGVYLECPAIYIDEGSGGMTVWDNLVEDIDPDAEILHYNKVFRTKEDFVFNPNVYENNGPGTNMEIKDQAGLQSDYKDILDFK